MNARVTGRRNPQKLRAKKLSRDSKTLVIQNGDEPIYLARDPADAALPGKDLPVAIRAVRLYVVDAVLPSMGLTLARYKSDSLTDAQRRHLFLTVYAAFGSTRAGCIAAGVQRSAVSAWRMDIEGFKTSMDDAYEDCVDELELEARRRAFTGDLVEEVTEKEVPIKDKDGKVSHVVIERVRKKRLEKSDTMMMFMLRGQRGRYANKTELTGADGGPVEIREIKLTIVDPKAPEQEPESSAA